MIISTFTTTMKTVVKVVVFMLLSQKMFGQHKQYERIHEIGFGVGGLNYTGDLSENLNLRYTKPAGNIFYRYNFRNEISVIRANVIVGQLGVDESKSSEPLRAQRGTEFSGLLTEVAGLYEYDFFNFRDIKNKYYMSPYMFGGISLTHVAGNSNTTFMGVPFGAGVKLRVKGGWNVGFEAGARKNFTDKIDGVTDEQAFGTSIQSDWHYYTGINLSYTFYKLICSVGVPRGSKDR